MAGCKVGKVAFSLLVLWCLGSLISGCTAASAVAIPGGRRLTAGGLAPAFWNSSSTEVGRVTGRELVDFEVKMNGSNFSEKVLSAQPPLADEDLGPLLKLRSAWNIAPSFWNDSLNPCGPSAWPGVRCSVVDNHQRVAFLTNPYLAFGDGRVLTGTIPDAIGDLSALEGVSLDSTRLTGKLPDSIGRLLNLKSLVITRSNLTGPLPFAIRTCVNLTEVDLTGNQLSGPITPGGQPLGLQILIVRDNYLTGEIPEELFGRLKQPIMVRGNCMESSVNDTQRPQEECNAWYTRNRPDRRVLQGIRLAWAPNGWFDSEDPCTAGTPGWQGITCDPMYGINVLGIDLHNTLIEGDLAEVQFENLPHLETLVLSNNPGLQGVIPPGLGTLPNLTVLYLDQCALHGPIPESFGNSSIAAAALAAQEFAEALNATGQPPLPLALNLRGNWFNGSVPSFFQWMDARIFADNCLDYTSELTPPPSQRSQGTCASFYRQVEKDSPQRFVNPGAYPFRSDPRLPLQPPPEPTNEGGLVAEYISVIVTIVVLSVIGTLVAGWWYRRRRKREHWKRLPKDEIPQEDWQFEAMAGDLPQYSISKLKQMTSNFAIENCLEGQPLLVDGQDPQTSLLLMNSSSNSIRDLFTLQNTVTPGCLYRGYTPSTAVLVRQLPPRRKESQKKIVPRVRFPGFRRKQRVTAGGALLEQNGVRIGPQKFLAAVGAMHRAEHPNLARVRAYNRAKNRSCFIVWEGFGRTIPITVRDALDGGAVKAFSGEQDAGALFLDWTARWRVMTEVASALQYLHEEHRPVLAHGFLSSTRVILGKGGKPFLTDFCLCTYLDKPASTVDDIYDFGVLLFELIRGHALEKGEAPQQLVRKAVSLLTTGHVSELLDVRLGGRFKEAELSGAVAAAAMCMQEDPLERPKMSLIVQTFKRSEDLADEMENPLGLSTRVPSFEAGFEPGSMSHFLDKHLAESNIPEWGVGDVEMTARGGAHEEPASSGGAEDGGLERPPMTMHVASSVWGASSEKSSAEMLKHQGGAECHAPWPPGGVNPAGGGPVHPPGGGENRQPGGFDRPPVTMEGAGSIWGGSSEASSLGDQQPPKGVPKTPVVEGGETGARKGGGRLWRHQGGREQDTASDKYRSWMMGGELQMHPEHIKLGTLLGQGSFGRVYHAVWLGTDIAVKVIPDIEGEGLTSVWREVVILRKLRHPNIVLFMAAVEVPSSREVYIVTEYLARGSLFDVLHREHAPEPISLSQRLSYALGVARGMGFLHLQGLVHRDLKTGNLLVGLDNTVKVCDFGQSRLLNQKSSKRPLSTLRAAGTISYMAPEVFRDPSMVDQKCDIYSFGVILWELLARKVPWAGVHEPQVITSVAAGLRPPIPAGEWDAELVRLIEACWEDDAEKRPTFEEVMVRLETILRALGGTEEETKRQILL